MRKALTVAALAALVAGCGGDGDARPTAQRQSQAPVLVELIQQRPGALIDKITVRTDGSGVFDRPSGGVGRVLRHVEVDPAALVELRAGLRHLPRRLPRGHGRLAPNGATYIVRFGGRTVVARQGREPARLRRPIRLLAAMLVGDHIRKIVDERLGGVAGSTHAAGVGKEKRR